MSSAALKAAALTRSQARGIGPYVDGLKDFPKAIEAEFPKTVVQLCLVHLVRNSLQLAALQITPEQGRQAKELWKTLQEEEASWSSRSEHQLIPDANHYIQFDRPDLVVSAVRRVVERLR